MRRVLALTVTALLVIAGCSGDDDSSTTTTAGANATTSTAGETTTTSEDTTTTAGANCDAPDVSVDALGLEAVSADVDGDGTNDTVSTYATGTADDPTWHLHLARNGGGAVDTIIEDAVAGANVRILGGAEITASAGLPPDGSGVEPFVIVGSGASVALVGIWQYSNCELVRLNGVGSTDPALFPVGASVTHFNGLRCEGVAGGQRLVELSAESTDGVSYTTSEELLKVDNFAFTSGSPPVAGSTDNSDPNLNTFATITCPGVQAP